MYSLKRACEKLFGDISKKTLLFALALTMIVASAAGGTVAFLYGSQNVKNTFTYSADISIDLTETDTGLDVDQNPDTNQYPMFPGQSITKDPVVTVHAGSMDCWLYVEITQSLNFSDFMEYTVADGWQPLEGVPGVYYREVDAPTETQYYPVLKDNQVNMKESVTLNMLASLTNADYPWLAFKAYAIQRDGSINDVATPENAWTLLPNVQTFAPPAL